MEPIFRQQYDISAIHVDCYGRTKPSVLLYFAQEAAGAHCLELAVDWDTLSRRNLFWAVIRTKMQITRLPKTGETITVETWPMPTTRVAFPRSTIGYDAQGNEVFRSISLWVLMDTNTRAMVLPGKSGIALEGTLRGNELATPGNLPLQVLEQQVSRRVGFCELDRNGHMNNTRYMDWVADLLDSSFHARHRVQEFTICYLSEAKEGEEIRISWSLGDGPCLQAEGKRTGENQASTGERVFSAQVIFNGVL